MAKIIVIGRAVRDPEYTPARGEKNQFTKFTIAEDNDFGDLSSYFDCVVFGKYADSAYKNMAKGRLVGVFGTFEQGETFTDRNGNKRRSWSLKVDKIRYLDSRKSDQADPTPAPAESEPVPDGFEQVEEDIPF